MVCFQAEDGIRELVRSRGLGDVYKRQDVSRHGADDVGLVLELRQAGVCAPAVGLEEPAALSLIHI